MEFIIYSILISLLYIYSGIGLAFLLCPKNFEKYSLYLSPFVGLSYISYVSWILAHYGVGGTDDYAHQLLIPPFIFIVIALIIKKKRTDELFWPFHKENILLIVISVVIFVAISSPYLLKLIELNTVTLGNNDIADYSTMSKFLTKTSVSEYQYQTGMDWKIKFLVEFNNFGAFISTAIPSSLFSKEPYKFQNIVIYLFYLFSLPIVFLVGFEIFKYNKHMAIIISLLFGINFHLIFINYHGFLGQVIGIGFFLSLFLIIVYPILNCNKLSCLIEYLPLGVLLTFGLIITYPVLMLLFFIPLLMYLLLAFISSKSVSRLLKALIFISLTIFSTFLISPDSFLNRMNVQFTFKNIIAGWDQPILSPEWVFGLVENNTTIWTQHIPIIYRVIISIPIVLIIIASFIHLFKKERQIFYISISYISFSFLMYIYLISSEILSPSFTGEGYKAYKLATYFIPIILLSGLAYLRKFHISFNTKITKNQMIGLTFLFVLIAGNILSASAMIRYQYDNFIDIKNTIIDLQKIAKMDNVSSINIVEASWWDQMWMNYFLFMEKKIYLKYSTYYPSSPLIGEWTLQKGNNRKNSIKMSIRFPYGHSGSQEPIVTTGKTGAGDFIFVHYISDGKIAFNFDHWGVGGPEIGPIFVDDKRFYPLEIVMDTSNSMIIIKFDDRIALRYSSPLHSTTSEEITIGENRIGGTGPGPHFSGEIQDLEKKTIVINDIITLSDIDQNIIEVNKDYYLVNNNMEATLSKGWYEIESNQYAQWRWTGENNETTALELDVRKQNISVNLILNYWPLDTNNNFSVFLDENYIKDCEDKRSCLLNDILISKGKHEMLFKTKLPPKLPGNGETRKLSYAFSDISITINNIKIGEKE